MQSLTPHSSWQFSKFIRGQTCQCDQNPSYIVEIPQGQQLSVAYDFSIIRKQLILRCLILV